jgi:hypothetical protein
MALPDNDHHVHSDGYYSEKGEADQDRMLEELADEIEQIDGVESVYPESDRIEVEYNGDEGVVQDARWEADGWTCGVTDVHDDWFEIRPE